MRNEFKIVGLVTDGCLWGYAAGAQLDWCDRSETCKAVPLELPHGEHRDQRPWQPQQIQLQNGSMTASSVGGITR